jgi:hypothetical protein
MTNRRKTTRKTTTKTASTRKPKAAPKPKAFDIEPSKGVSEENWKVFGTNCEVIGGNKLKKGQMVRVENVYHSSNSHSDVAFCRTKAGNKQFYHIAVEHLELKTPFTSAEMEALAAEREERQKDTVLVEATVKRVSGGGTMLKWPGCGKACWVPTKQMTVHKDMEGDEILAEIPAWVVSKNVSDAELEALREIQDELEKMIA